jgi:hypothetical protein
MRDQLTKWLFGMGVVCFLVGGWALQHTARPRTALSSRAARVQGKRIQRAARGVPAHTPRGGNQGRSEYWPPPANRLLIVACLAG